MRRIYLCFEMDFCGRQKEWKEKKMYIWAPAGSQSRTCTRFINKYLHYHNAPGIHIHADQERAIHIPLKRSNYYKLPDSHLIFFSKRMAVEERKREILWANKSIESGHKHRHRYAIIRPKYIKYHSTPNVSSLYHSPSIK